MKTSYASIQAQINELTQKAEAIRASEVASVIAEIKTKMNDLGISITDLKFVEGEKGKDAKAEKVVFTRRKPGVKYMDAITGNAWTGRGKTPMWMKEAFKDGKTKDDFLVAEGSVPNVAPKAEKKAASQAEIVDGRVVYRRRKPEVKYMDAETGNSWSGRGKTPLWMQSALKTGRSMSDFSVGS